MLKLQMKNFDQFHPPVYQHSRLCLDATPAPTINLLCIPINKHMLSQTTCNKNRREKIIYNNRLQTKQNKKSKNLDTIEQYDDSQSIDSLFPILLISWACTVS